MNDQNALYAIVVCTLAAVMVSVILVLLIGLFNPLVDNNKIFEILGPAFHMIVGAFVGVLSSKFINGTPPPKP